MTRLPDSSRFHIIHADRVQPRYGRLAARPIYVYLPQEVDHDHRRRFPVVYCQDGQNIWDDPHACFGHGGWYLNRIVDELVDDGRIEPVILVGIPNSDSRYREYTPGKTFEDIFEHAYANFVVDVVKRYVDKRFPTKRDRAHTAVLGSSLGGLMSLWMAHKLHETFGRAACLSGAFQVKDRRGESFADFLSRRGHQHLKIYVDCGTVHDGIAASRKVYVMYLKRGWREGLDFCYHEEKGAQHNERCWRERVWRALVFLFAPNR